MSPKKEPNFFSRFYPERWPWYESLFEDSDPQSLCGEGSTSYVVTDFAELSCQRIAEHFPNVRLIMIARDPITRIESIFREHHYRAHRFGIEVPDEIGDALNAFPAMINDTLYWQRLSTYRKRFSDDQIHLLFFEDLVRQPGKELRRCFDFLGVDPAVDIPNVDRKMNPGTAKFRSTKLMRRLLSFRWLNKCWNWLPGRVQDTLGELTGLRRRFKSPIAWSSEALDSLLEQIADDAGRFLEHCGKPASFWNLHRDRSVTSSSKQRAA